MTETISILKSKLLIPRLTHTIKRDRLLSMMSDLDKKRITTVISGAGYGKSTLVAQVCHQAEFDTVWYRLDAYDRDLITFLDYLIHGIRKYYESFGRETVRRIDSSQQLTMESEEILTVFLRELESFINKELVIVLDDYHLVSQEQEINTALEFIIERFSPLIHLVLISRKVPDIPLSLYRARRETLEISEKDIAFTLEETGQLYENMFDVDMSTENLDTLFKKTHGWVSGLILVYLSLKGRNFKNIESVIEGLKGSHQVIFAYLDENVYDSLPDDFKRFLTKTSILSRLDIAFCDRFLKISNSRDILNDLEQRHLFTFPFDEERNGFYYHHLFQDFLLKKLKNEHQMN